MRSPTPLFPVIVAKLLGGSGGSVTPAAIVTATEQMTEEQAADTLTNIGGVTSDDVDAKLTPYTITMTHTSAIPGNGTWTSSKTWAQLVTAYSAGKPIHAIIGGLSLVGGRVVVTHMIGNQMVIYLTGDDDSQNHYDGFYMILSDGSFTYTDLTPAPDTLNVTIDQNYDANFTPAEMYAAYLAGKMVILKFPFNGSYLQTGDFNYDGQNAVFYMIGHFTDDNGNVYPAWGMIGFKADRHLYRLDIGALALDDYIISNSDTSVTIDYQALIASEEMLINGYVHDLQAPALTSLTITSPPATGKYTIKFNSGSTPTTTTIPATIHGLENFAAAANTHYEINVEDNYALVASWPLSSS